MCLFVSKEKKQNRALFVRNRMSQLFAAFHPFKVVEESSQTLSVFVTLLQHLWYLRWTMSPNIRISHNFQWVFKKNQEAQKILISGDKKCCKSLNSIILLFYVGLELQMLETRREWQFRLFQEAGQMIPDKAKLSENEFALFTNQTCLPKSNLRKGWKLNQFVSIFTL